MALTCTRTPPRKSKNIDVHPFVKYYGLIKTIEFLVEIFVGFLWVFLNVFINMDFALEKTWTKDDLRLCNDTSQKSFSLMQSIVAC